MYILKGYEQGVELYSETFETPGDAMNYAHEWFRLSHWKKINNGWEIVKKERRYEICLKSV